MRLRLSLALPLAALALPAPAAADPAGWGTASDVGRDALVVAAFGLPLVKKDKDGLVQAGLSVGSTFLVTAGMKKAIDETRPDGSDGDSFPSGHTSMSFASAATINNRYGWKYGLPAHAVAAFVGVARVQADKHYWHDVIVGAAIGEAAGLLFTKKRDAKVQLVPWGDAHGGGLHLAARF